MKKIVFAILVFSVFFSNQYAVSASQLGSLGHWYSGTNHTIRWRTAPLTGYRVLGIQDSQDFTTSALLSHVNYARNQWRRANITIGTTTNINNATLKIYGGSLQGLLSQFLGISSEHTGLVIRLINIAMRLPMSLDML